MHFSIVHAAGEGGDEGGSGWVIECLGLLTRLSFVINDFWIPLTQKAYLYTTLGVMHQFLHSGLKSILSIINLL